MFVVVVSFINSFWEPTHVIIGVFEVKNIIGTSMAKRVNLYYTHLVCLTNSLLMLKTKAPI
jgi:hypothetical protein